jgi:hypothetical protein
MKLSRLVVAMGLLFASTSCGSDDSTFIDDTSRNDAAIADAARTDIPIADLTVRDMQSADLATTETRTADSAIGDTRTDVASSDATSDGTLVDSAATDSRSDAPWGDGGSIDSANLDDRAVDAAIVDVIIDTSIGDSGDPDGADSAEAQPSDGAPADSTDGEVTNPSVTVTRAGNGSGTVTSSPAGIDCGATCSASYLPGTLVILDAAPAVGSTFTGWSGGGCAGTGSCQMTVNDATTVIANFVLEQYPLTVTPAGNGTGTVTSSPAGINCGSTCTASFNYGLSVTLTASAAAGSGFTGWSGSGCMGTAPCIVPITAASAVTATFTVQYTLTVGKDGNGAGTVTSSPAGINCGGTCAAAFAEGQNVTLTAAPSTGSAFTGWSDSGCPGTAPCTLSITAASSVTATFTLLPRTLTVNKAGAGTGTVQSSPAGIDCGATCSAVFNHGTVVSVFAISGASGAFMGWSGACAGTGACSITMNSSRSVTATFEPPLTCTTGSTASFCTNGTAPEINLGTIAPATCHDQCQIAMRQAGMTTGCWIFASDGHCYCRSGSLSNGGARPGGFCN